MDPVSIAAGLGALLAPYLKKAGEEFAGEAGKYVQEKAKGLWEKLRKKLEGDPPATQAMDDFEADPDGARGKFEAQVEKKAKEDSALGDELAQELAEIKRRAPYVRVVIQVDEAEKLTGVKAQRLKSGTVDAKIEGGKVGEATGADLGEIG
jgi:hypothetical protein